MFNRNMTFNAHKIIAGHLAQKSEKGLLAIDATVGNGFDLAFLASCEQIEEIIGFDIQSQAITNSYSKIKDIHKKIKLIQASHHLIENYIEKTIDVAMFNLGYLPSADKHIVTCVATTLQAINHVIKNLSPGGICTIMTYPGHEEGKKEHEMIKNWVESNYDKTKMVFSLNIEQTKSPCPHIFIVINK